MRAFHFLIAASLALSCIRANAQELPSYYHENGYIESRIKSIPKGKSFIFITDIHQERNAGSPTLLPSYISGKAKVGITIFGGDCFDWAKDAAAAKVKLTSTFSQFERDLPGRFLWVTGNHDANSSAVSKYKIPADVALISDKDEYELTTGRISGMIHSDRYTDLKLEAFPEKFRSELEFWSGLYYYYDDARARVRYIVLESGDNGPSIRNVLGKSAFVDFQTEFLHNCLETVPNGYDVVIATHMLVNGATGVLKNYTPWFREAVAFRKSGKGRILMLCGHSHIDNAFAVSVDQAGIMHSEELPSGGSLQSDSVLLVIVNCDSNASYQKYAHGENINLKMSKAYYPMKKGTVGEHCLDVVTFAKHKIAFTRFGVGEDRVFIY